MKNINQPCINKITNNFQSGLNYKTFFIESEGGNLKLLSMEMVYGICLVLFQTINLFIFPIEIIFIYIDLNLQN
jgi:hypothetical protein